MQRANFRKNGPSRQRRGIIVVLTAFLLVVLMAMIAFSVDVGYMSVVRTEIQTAADSAALAGAGELPNGTAAAQAEALEFLGKNRVGKKKLKASNADIEFGMWNSATRTFTVNNSSPNSIRVTATSNNQPLFFGSVLGQTKFNTQAQATATFQPREISLVLDYSGSMCYDSQFRNINLLGQDEIEANLLQIYQELGSPSYGNWRFKFEPTEYGNGSTSKSTIKTYFGLSNSSYPYPDGSWDEYIDYVQDDYYVDAAGYENCYGYMTWLNYVMSKEGSANDAPGFHAVSQQPVTALKDAVDVFLAYLQLHSTDDRVALSIYTAADGTGKLEHGLTGTYSTIANTCRARQAGHYTSGTNISAGMTKGRVELQNNARPGAFKMMILMTDGVVNLPTGNTNTDKQKVLDEAELCAAAKIPVVTIALGAYADTDLMQEVADMTGGACFIVPGGQPIAQVKAQLEAVFAEVAADRPLQIVK
jgi:Flp pilus assembly protein TadG